MSIVNISVFKGCGHRPELLSQFTQSFLKNSSNLVGGRCSFMYYCIFQDKENWQSTKDVSGQANTSEHVEVSAYRTECTYICQGLNITEQIK